ncbi:hypothetical protein FNJ62_05865 [Streptomyces benahoarensis]|uniref:DUF1023 domain-containing protein n=2 Tax=Streptomyces benahoarensis TaxID=2595054 RepID=A0A553ZQE8_9ACTN|nr:hypothetical protein FNJ62_05865 [Streptomyces benahoarensis]TSB43643.1 hypothetical protein FNZ23_03135 [Streptomyces benahoarensis]
MRAARLRRGLLISAAAGCLVFSVTAAAHSHATQTPVAPRLPALSADTLEDRYAANRHYMAEAERAAGDVGDGARADRLGELRSVERNFLSFSPVGDGQAVEVLGDLAHADRIAVVVPGSDTTIDTFDMLGSRYGSLAGGARGLYAEAKKLDPKSRVAVVAWYGYRAPRTQSVEVLTKGRAEEGGQRLEGLIRQLRQVNPAARTTLLCHSYGSVVCGSAMGTMAPGTASALSDIVVFGSPGMGVRSRSELGTHVPFWAGRGTRDWIADVPHASVSVFGVSVGFGSDPTSTPFGAKVLPAGSAQHSDYLKPGGIAVRNIALITLGRGAEVSRG